MDFSTFTLDQKQDTGFKEWAECRELKAQMDQFIQENPDRQFLIGKDNYKARPKESYWIQRVR